MTDSMVSHRMVSHYEVIDGHTGECVATHRADQRKNAYRFAERKNAEYGAHRYVVMTVMGEVGQVFQ